MTTRKKPVKETKAYARYQSEHKKMMTYLKAFGNIIHKDAEYAKGISRLMTKNEGLRYDDPQKATVRAKLNKLFTVQSKLGKKGSELWNKYKSISKSNKLRWKRMYK